MALKIRLARGGSKKRPFYRIVVADSRAPRDGRFVERLGYYNPMVAKDNPERLRFDTERIRHWLSKGALPTDRVARFLGQADIIPMPVRPEQTKQHLPKAKAQERAREIEEKATAAADAALVAAQAPAEEAPVEATPVEDVPAEAAAATDAPVAGMATEDAPTVEAPPEEALAESPAAPSEAAPETAERDEAAKTDGAQIGS